jgi:hypothetical protein
MINVNKHFSIQLWIPVCTDFLVQLQFFNWSCKYIKYYILLITLIYKCVTFDHFTAKIWCCHKCLYTSGASISENSPWNNYQFVEQDQQVFHNSGTRYKCWVQGECRVEFVFPTMKHILSSRWNFKVLITSVQPGSMSLGRDSVVSIATRYGLDSPGIESRWGRDFQHPFSVLYNG